MIKTANRPKRGLGMLAMAAALGLSFAAQATPMLYTDMTQWETAVDNLHYLPDGYILLTEDFAGSPSGLLPAGSTDIGLFDMVLSNETTFNSISDAPNKLVNVDLFAGGGLSGATQIGWTNFDVPRWIHGIGFSVNGFEKFGDSGLTLSVNGTDLFLAADDQDFIGIVDLDRITTLTLSGDNEFFTLDNVIVAIREVPEPATLSLFAIGLAGLGFARRRRSWALSP